MGVCSSDQCESLLNAEIERTLLELHGDPSNQQPKHIKMLLLGAPESGKSTVMKQMEVINGQWSRQKLVQNRDLVRRNTIAAMQGLCEGYAKIHHVPYADERCLAQCQSAKDHSDVCPHHPIAAAIERMKAFKLETAYSTFLTLQGRNASSLVGEIVVEYLRELWACETINGIITHASELNLHDSTKYFLNEVDRIFEHDYVPTEQDLLRTRSPTSGMRHIELTTAEGVNVSVFDVGGQRGQRKKWISCFDDVTCVLFVASLSEFNQKLEEDQTKDRISESLQLFQALNELIWFGKTPMVIFFNKGDVFREKLESGVQLKKFLPEYDGSNDFDSAASFIQGLYEARTQKRSGLLYCHRVVAIDTKNMKKAIDHVQKMILTKITRTCVTKRNESDPLRFTDLNGDQYQ